MRAVGVDLGQAIDERGQTLLHYINIGRFVALNDEALVWDDYAVDILAHPDRSVDVIDEGDLPAEVDASTRRFIADATAAVLTDVAAIVAACERETAVLLGTEVDVVQR